MKYKIKQYEDIHRRVDYEYKAASLFRYLPSVCSRQKMISKRNSPRVDLRKIRQNNKTILPVLRKMGTGFFYLFLFHFPIVF